MLNLYYLAEASKQYGIFDIKTWSGISPNGAGTGKLLNGKYVSAESAGNYLAGLNAADRIGFDAFMRIAGALHQGGFSSALWSSVSGKEYGPYPWYGEHNYCARRVIEGWIANPNSIDRKAALQRFRLKYIIK